MTGEQPIIIVTDGRAHRVAGTLVSHLGLALRAGRGAIGAVLVREKSASLDELKKILSELRPICEQVAAKLLVHTHVELVSNRFAHGVHVSGDIDQVLKLREKIRCSIGFSAHSVAEIVSAGKAGVDYVFYSPIFSPLSKVDERPVVGISGLACAVEVAEIPIFALGGISANNAGSCRRAGANGIAVLSSVMNASDVEEAVVRLVHAWRRG